MVKERTGDSVITLISDFGDRFAQAQVELAVHAVNPQVKFMLISNEVTPFSILEGAFLLAKSYQFSPRDSIHVAVVDPGVGSERKGLIIRTQDYWFVGPDNGLLYPAAEDNGIKDVFAIDQERLNLTGLNTFHGRDVFAPAAARLSLGESPLNFANPVDLASICPYTFEPNQVAHIDWYGNIKLTSLSEQFQVGDQLSIDLTTGRIIIPFCRTFADVPQGALLAYQGSHGTLELARNLGSAAQVLQVFVGQKLAINSLAGSLQLERR